MDPKFESEAGLAANRQGHRWGYHHLQLSFSLAGEAVANAGTPGSANCHGKTISALVEQLGSIDQAASALGFSRVTALQDGFKLFCQQ